MRIALCQTASAGDKAANLAAALDQLDHAAMLKADVAILPECLDYLGPDEGVWLAAEAEGGPFAQAIADRAKALGLWVIGGTVRVRAEGNRVGNTMIAYDPQGCTVATYRKLHMFDLSIPGQVEFLESNTVKPGHEIVTADIAGVPSGFAICYDLRFPELFRLLAMNGAKIIWLPAAFTAFTGRDHWEVLLRARAIENQCYIVAADQIGTPMPGLALYGRSMVIDPWGTVIGCAPDRAGVTMVDIDPSAVESIRERLPSLVNRRNDVYVLSADVR